MNIPVKKILIVGGGLIGWWAAVFLKKSVPNIHISILNSQVEDTYAETLEPNFANYLQLIGLTEQHIIKYTDGNFAFAQAYFGWLRTGNNYFHSADGLSFDYDAVEFNQWILKLRKNDPSIKIDDYSVSAVAARLGKSPLRLNKKPIAALSFDLGLLKKLLMSYALDLAIDVINKELLAVELDSAGDIDFIVASDASILTSDFYIDASGYTGDLIAKAMGVAYESWSAYLPFHKKKISVVPQQDSRLIPFTSLQLTQQGWLKSIPLKNKIVCEYIYDDALLGAENGKNAIADFFVNGQDVNFYPGQRQKIWHKNCLAMGAAAITADGFSHSPLYLAAVTLKQFMAYWPSHQQFDAVENEFNRLMRTEYESIRDLHCLHYAVINMQAFSTNTFWREIKLPESLQYRLDLFMETGRALPDESTLLHPSQWIHLALGLGCWPRKYDYIASHHSDDIYVQYSQSIKASIQASIENLPDYTDYLKSYIS